MRTLTKLFAACAAGLIMGTIIPTQGAALDELNTQEMSIVIARSPGSRCEPLCPQWIAADGVITERTVRKFEEIFRELGPSRLPVIINSIGGDFDAALEIGHLIHERGIDVGVASTEYIRCGPEVADCLSKTGRKTYKGIVLHYGQCRDACVFVLAGGTRRMGGGAVLIIPSIEQMAGPQDSKHYVDRIETLFAAADIGSSLVRRIMGSSQSDFRSLLDEESRRYGLLNVSNYAQDLGDPTSCYTGVTPRNCVPAH